MSVFIVSNNHIQAISVYLYNNQYDLFYTKQLLKENKTNCDSLHFISKRFIDCNIKSYNTNYDCELDSEEFILNPNLPKYTGIEIYKLIECLIYQSCEYVGWTSSLEKAVLEEAKHYALRTTKEYNNAEWCI